MVGAESLTRAGFCNSCADEEEMQFVHQGKFAGRLCLSNLVKCLLRDANGNNMQSNEGGQYFTWW